MSSPVTVLGISLATYTLLHTLIAVVGIVAGLVAVLGWALGKTRPRWTAVFLGTTVATSVTGYGFPFERLLPSHVVGAISLVVLAVAIAARYAYDLRGPWRRVYVISAVIALYLNVFVGVVQSFLKVPALRALAPAQTEPPFVLSQGLVLLAFVALAVIAALRFQSDLPLPGSRPR
jgi:hypothetical protein